LGEKISPFDLADYDRVDPLDRDQIRSDQPFLAPAGTQRAGIGAKVWPGASSDRLENYTFLTSSASMQEPNVYEG
jgi:hypothetical protein